MSEVLFQYAAEFTDDGGRHYHARACGRERRDGRWEGWLEFVPLDGGRPIRTDRETTQPDRRFLEYWATGLTTTYLDGALLRATKPTPAVWLVRTAPPPASVPRPSPRPRGQRQRETLPPAPPVAVLDPFAVFAEGDHVLRGQLRALDAGQLRTIVRAYRLSSLGFEELEQLTQPDLVGLIMGEVSERAHTRG